LIFRLLKLESLANRIYEEASPETKSYLQAYADGVNEAIEETKVLPSDSSWIQLNDRPEPWRPQDSVLVLLLQSFDQTRKSFEKQIQAERALKKNPEIFKSIPIDVELPWEIPILPTPTTKGSEKSKKNAFIRVSMPDWENNGSNNWVVSSKFSGTKTAWLANDPHLELKTPSFWYWVEPSLKDQQWFGASVPGIPILPSGVSLKMAWGLTNAYLDFAETLDLPIEEVKKDLISEYPLIWIKFGFLKLPFFFKKIQYLPRNFPILPIESKDGHIRVLNWSGYSYTGRSLDFLFKFHESESIEAMDEALKNTQISGWNFVFANTEGKIGYRAIGLAFRPIPKSDRSEDPVPVVSRKTLENRQFLSVEQMPSILHPEQDFILTANHRHWPEGGRAYSPGFRAWRIRKLLTELPKPFDFSSHQKIQCDDYVTDASFLVPLLIQNFRNLWNQYPDIYNLFSSWNYRATEDCRACLLYRRWMDRIAEDYNISESQLYALLVKTVTPKIQKVVETSFLSMLKDIDWNGKSINEFPTWGEKHRLYLRHISGSKKMENDLSIATRGDSHTIDPGTADWVSEKKEYEHRSGASFRMVIELSTPPKVKRIFPGTQQQDHPQGTEDPRTWVNRWKNCELLDIEFPFDLRKATTEKFFRKNL
jgi:penicillin amidase